MELAKPISRKSLKPKATAGQVQQILTLHKQGRTNKQIADHLAINGQSVNGIIASAKRQGHLPPAAAATKGAVATAFPPPPSFQNFRDGEEKFLKELKEAWKKADPDAEYSLHATDGQKFYIACYPGKGLVLKTAKNAKPAFLAWPFAMRLGHKLVGFAQEVSRR
jgi:ABC-type branched-subunit amino acid transport system substrate-binding protein